MSFPALIIKRISNLYKHAYIIIYEYEKKNFLVKDLEISIKINVFKTLKCFHKFIFIFYIIECSNNFLNLFYK